MNKLCVVYHGSYMIDCSIGYVTPDGFFAGGVIKDIEHKSVKEISKKYAYGEWDEATKSYPDRKPIINFYGNGSAFEITEEFAQQLIKAEETEEIADIEKERQEEISLWENVLKRAENTTKNSDGSLMSTAQAKIWVKNYNDINNEGGEGYVPSVITQENYDYAIAKLNNLQGR